jgi:hypothetical protein
LARSPLQARDSEAAEPSDTGIVTANGLLLLGVHLGLAGAVETTQAQAVEVRHWESQKPVTFKTVTISEGDRASYIATLAILS